MYIIILLTLPLALIAQSDLVDRIVATVDGEIITLSDIRTEKVMREILGEPPAQNDRELIDELIDQRIIRGPLERDQRAEPTEAEVDEQMSPIRDYKGLSLVQVREAIREHLRVHLFFLERFGQSLRASDIEIREYYDNVLVPDARTRGLPIRALPEIMEDLRPRVLEQKLNAEIRKWLERVRRTKRIQIFN